MTSGGKWAIISSFHNKDGYKTMKGFTTIRSRLFVCYSAIIFALIVAFSLAYSHQTSRLLEDKASQTVEQLAVNIAHSLDAELESMNSVANRVISSELIKNIFYDRPETEVQRLKNRRDLFQLLFTASGSAMKQQIHLIGRDGRFASYGNNFDITRIPVEWVDAFPAFMPCLRAEGRAVIAPPHASAWRPQSATVVSLCRAFSPVFGAPYDAIAEIQQDYSVFSGLIEHALPGEKSILSAYVYTSDGKWIYPFDMQEATPLFGAGTQSPLHTRLDKRSVIAAYAQCAMADWTVVVFEDEDILLAGVRSFQRTLYLIGAIVLLATLTISYFIAKQLTRPLRRLRHAINHLSLASPGEAYPLLDTSAYELDALNHSYMNMVGRLQTSLEETVAARSQEIQARMRALQAQMNPHFLYNTIATISIKAEDAGELEIVSMCDALTEMLRYVTKDTDRQVTLAVELRYLEQYLSLLKTRYPSQFTVTMEIPDEMKPIPVPKLVLQPVVENCFKHAFNCRAPWTITLRGEYDQDSWRITIADNGVGFDEATLATIRQHVERPIYDVSGEAKIGLLNIFYRLKLQDKEHAVFRVENLPSGGSAVTIGGAWKP